VNNENKNLMLKKANSDFINSNEKDKHINNHNIPSTNTNVVTNTKKLKNNFMTDNNKVTVSNL